MKLHLCIGTREIPRYGDIVDSENPFSVPCIYTNIGTPLEFSNYGPLLGLNWSINVYDHFSLHNVFFLSAPSCIDHSVPLTIMIANGIILNMRRQVISDYILRMFPLMHARMLLFTWKFVKRSLKCFPVYELLDTWKCFQESECMHDCLLSIGKLERRSLLMMFNILSIWYINMLSRSWMQRKASSDRYPRVLLFPEGTTTNGRVIISFQLGAFIPGFPIQPVVVRYPHIHFDQSW